MEPKDNLKTVQHALAMLDLLAGQRHNEMGTTDLSRALGLSKTAAHRLATTLHGNRFLHRNPDTGRYSLGMRLWELGCRAVGRLGIREVAFPHLEELWRQTGETVYLATYDQCEVVWVEKIESRKSVRVHTRLGGRAPAHCVACGKAILAFSPHWELEIVLGDLQRFTEYTITDRAIFQAELQTIRQRGYAVADREWDRDVIGVAAPVRNSTHRVVASIGLSAPRSLVSPMWESQMGPAVAAAAAGLSSALGYLPALSHKAGMI